MLEFQQLDHGTLANTWNKTADLIVKWLAFMDKLVCAMNMLGILLGQEI